MKTKRRPHKHPKLRGRIKVLASKFIAEEIRTRSYPPAQAKAVGISRARAEVERQETRSDLLDMLARYKHRTT